MPEQLQRYLIRLYREANGTWTVTGHWECIDPIRKCSSYPLDGAARNFNSRREALEFLLNAQGIPE